MRNACESHFQALGCSRNSSRTVELRLFASEIICRRSRILMFSLRSAGAGGGPPAGMAGAQWRRCPTRSNCRVTRKAATVSARLISQSWRHSAMMRRMPSCTRGTRLRKPSRLVSPGGRSYRCRFAPGRSTCKSRCRTISRNCWIGTGGSILGSSPADRRIEAASRERDAGACVRPVGAGCTAHAFVRSNTF